MEQGYLAQVQALIDQKWKENPEEMKRVMAEIEAKEKDKAKAEPPKRISFDPQLTQELIEELNKNMDMDILKIKDLIERGADVNAKEEYGKTPLHSASYKDNIELAKLLIDSGADLEAKDKWGWTPLHWASIENYIELAELLLERGADVKAKNDDGETPLHWASYNNSIETAELLLDRGADLEAKDEDGKTPLHLAKSREMRYLLQRYQK